jgi:predicted nuclease of predicted toxin-antitoxin system
VIDDRRTLKLLLDEGVPDSVGRIFQEFGHHVTYLNRSPARGEKDHFVCRLADLNESILVALDGDMKRIARDHGVGAGRYLKLGLIKLSCKEPRAAERVKSAMSLIEHEWMHGESNPHRKIFVEIGDLVIRTYR